MFHTILCDFDISGVLFSIRQMIDMENSLQRSYNVAFFREEHLICFIMPYWKFMMSHNIVVVINSFV